MYPRAMKLNRRGFTVVEVLMVIVVIAILAAVSVVTYNGMQKRAQYSAIAATLNTYEKGFRLYKAAHGEFPHSAGYAYSCLGKISDYPAEGLFGEGQCGFVNSSYDTDDRIDDSLNQSLKEFLTDIPNIPLTQYTYSDGSTTRGIYYEGNEKWYYFEYGLPNGSECPYGEDAWGGEEVLCTVLQYDP